MSFSIKNNENTHNQSKITFSQFVNQQARQFGKEISNIPSRAQLDIQPFKGKTSARLYSEIKIEEEPVHQPQLVHNYAAEIFEYLKTQEYKYICTPNYMQHQQDINSSMRSILIDWLIDVHLKFKLLHETLFLTINLIDRFLTKNSILRSKLQLVGVAALFISSKYEEIYAPELKDFVYVCDHAYNKEEILEMESKILQTVQFNLTQTSSLRFLERQVSGANICDKVTNTAKLILDLSLIEIKSLKYVFHPIRYSSSVQATASILLAINLLKSPQVLPSSLHYIDDPEDLKKCLQDFLVVIQSLNNANLTAVKRKYQTEKFTKVSELLQGILINQQQTI